MSFVADLFGGHADKPQVNFSMPGFKGGGLTGSFDGSNYGVSADPTRTGEVQGLGDAFKNLGDITGTLRNTVGAGFNDMLTSRLNDLSDVAHSAIGNLRDNLASRRVLGSSFGSDTLTRANAEFGRARDAAIADNFQKSLAMNNALLTQQYDAYAKQHQSALNELNLEASTSSDLSAKAAGILADNARTQASLNEKNGEFNAGVNNNYAGGFGRVVGGLLGF